MTNNPTRQVTLKTDYDDIGYTGRFVKAGATGQAYRFSLTASNEDDILWKVAIDGYEHGEITMRQSNLDFTQELRARLKDIPLENTLKLLSWLEGNESETPPDLSG